MLANELLTKNNSVVILDNIYYFYILYSIIYIIDNIYYLQHTIYNFLTQNVKKLACHT